MSVRDSTLKGGLRVSAPEILERPAPQLRAQLFGAPRPERPRAPANRADARPDGISCESDQNG